MEWYSNLNNIVQTYKVWSKWIDGHKTAEAQLKMLKEKLSKVPVILKDFEWECSKNHKKCKCARTPHTLRDLESMAEISGGDYWLLSESIPDEELNIIEDKIIQPWPTIYLYGEDLENNFAEKYPLSEVVLPIGAVRVIEHPEPNAISILFERDSRLHYIEMVMLDKWAPK